jgi:hypothetical protein
MTSALQASCLQYVRRKNNRIAVCIVFGYDIVTRHFRLLHSKDRISTQFDLLHVQHTLLKGFRLELPGTKQQDILSVSIVTPNLTAVYHVLLDTRTLLTPDLGVFERSKDSHSRLSTLFWISGFERV